MPNPRDGFDEIEGPLDDATVRILRSDSGLKDVEPLLGRGSRRIEFLLRNWFGNNDYDGAEAARMLLAAMSAAKPSANRARLLADWLSIVVSRDAEPDSAVLLNIAPLIRLLDFPLSSREADDNRHRAQQFAATITNRLAHGRVPFVVDTSDLEQLQQRFGPVALRNAPLGLIERGLKSDPETAVALFHGAWQSLHEQALSTVEGLNVHELKAAALAYQRLRSLSGVPAESKQDLESARALYKNLLVDVVAYGTFSEEDRAIGQRALEGGRLPVSRVTRPRVTSLPARPANESVTPGKQQRPDQAKEPGKTEDPAKAKAGNRVELETRPLGKGQKLVLTLGSIILIAVVGPFLAASIDNASPQDGGVAGIVVGFLVWVLLRSQHCLSWKGAWTVGLVVAVGVIVHAHYNLFIHMQTEVLGRADRGDAGYESSWVDLSPRTAYRAWLSRELDTDGVLFMDHLRRIAQDGTVAWEKPFMYFPIQRVYRQGSEVWWGWLGQVLWILITVPAGALLAVAWEQEKRA